MVYSGHMYLTAEEKKDLVYEREVTSEGGGERRWYENMASVVKAEDGKFYRINYDRGLTENQDDEFNNGEVPEVFPVRAVRVESETRYLTEDEQKISHPSLAQKLLAEQESYSIVTGKELKAPISEEIYSFAVALRELLPELESLDIAADSGSHREATLQYLDALVALKEGAN